MHSIDWLIYMINGTISALVGLVIADLWAIITPTLFDNRDGIMYQYVAPIIGLLFICDVFQEIIVFCSAHDWLHWLLMLALISYLIVSLSYKKRLKPLPYGIILCLSFALFVYITTALLGEYYFNDLYQFKPVYTDQLERISIQMNMLSTFFKIGFEHYFIPPDVISFYSYHFIQYYLAKFIFAGIFLQGALEILKELLSLSE